MLLGLVALAAGTLPEIACLALVLGAHLLVPIWSAAIARRDTRMRAIVLGPGIVIGVHTVALVITLLAALGGAPEGGWITLMIVFQWALALVAYAAYCAIAFALVTRGRRR